MRFNFTLFILLFLLPFIGYSQINNLKEGGVLYEKYNYIDAQKVYENVVKKGYTSANIYGGLGDSYYYQNNFKQASNWYDLLIQKYPKEISYTQYLRAIESFRKDNQKDKAITVLALYNSQFKEFSGNIRFDSEGSFMKSFDASNYVLEKLGINSKGSDHSPSFYGDSQIVYASSNSKLPKKKKSNTKEEAFFDIYVADRDIENGRLRNKRLIKGDINTKFHESATAFTKDGKTMYFTRNRVLKKKKTKDLVRLGIFKAELQNDMSWKVVEDLPINGDDISTAYPALNTAENKLYFSSDREGSLGMSDIWFIDLYPDGTYGYPVHLGNTINTKYREAFLFIDKEDVLYFASDGHEGFGGLDIFKTRLNSKGMPTVLQNIGDPFNSPKDDFSFIIDIEKGVGYFSTNRELNKSTNDDLYYFYPDCSIQIKGVLKDLNTKKEILGGQVKLLNEYNETLFSQTLDENASFNFKIDCNTNFLLVASGDNYLQQEISIQGIASSGVITQDILLEAKAELVANDLGGILALRPIYFNFEDYQILKAAEIELTKISEAMKMYPNLVVHIESHTDSRGSDYYNMILSENRAKATRAWLINQGIAPHRLTAKGYGESRLVNRCADGVECSEKEHLMNRRSNFIIQED